MSFLLLFISFNFLPIFHSQNAPIVRTKFGLIQAFSPLNGSIDCFLGIPYARPPIGKLRFEKPIPPLHWHQNAFPLNASIQRESCWPHATPDWATVNQGPSSEDCLFLNIFAPKNNKSANSPVFVIIHGGGFETGTSKGQFSNYTDFWHKFIRHGIVVVSIQYRLGIFGFSSTGDPVMPGNLGLWDQRMALKFLRQNIAAFGGNPRQITLMGLSAGAVSVSALGLSPFSQGLFQRAIQVSGSALSAYAYGSRVVNETRKLARTLNCSMGTSRRIKKCLKKANVEDLLKAVVEMGSSRVEPNPLILTPRIDSHLFGDFFPADIPKLIKNAPRKPTMMGLNNLEGLFFTLIRNRNTTMTWQALPWADIASFGPGGLKAYIDNQIAYPARFGHSDGQVSGEIFKFYTNASSAGRMASALYNSANNSQYFLHQHTMLVGDLFIGLPIVDEILQKAKSGWPLFAYFNSFANPKAFPAISNGYPGVYGNFHTNDYNYIFHNPSQSFVFNEEDRKIAAFLQEAIQNFVIKGNPSTTQSIPLNWPKVPISSPGSFRHVHIQAPNPLVETNSINEFDRLNFWKQLAVDFPQFNVLREIPGK